MKLGLVFHCSLVILSFAFTTSPGYATPDSPAPIKLGATLALTGGASFWGVNARRGMEFAIEEVNSAGGVRGRPLSAIYEDFGELDVKRAATAVQKLLSVDKVHALFTLWSEDSNVAWPIAEAAKVVVVSIAAGADGLPAKSPYLFRVWPSDRAFVSETVKYAVKAGKRRAAVVATQTAYFTSLQELTTTLWKEKTGDSPFVMAVDPNQNDFRAEALKLKQGNYDVIFLHVNLEREGVLLKQAAQTGVKALRIGTQESDSPTVQSVAKESADGLIFPRYEGQDVDFEVRFTKRFSEKPGIPAQYAYDAVKLVAKVMNDEGTDAEAIQRGLLRTRDYPGASGRITIDSTGDRLGKEVRLYEIKAGKAVPVL